MTPKVDMLLEDTETVINYSKFQIGDWAEVYSTDKLVMKRFEKFCNEHPDYCKLIKEDKYSMTFSIDPKCASLYPKAPRKGHPVSEEQRQAFIDRLVKPRKAPAAG